MFTLIDIPFITQQFDNCILPTSLMLHEDSMPFPKLWILLLWEPAIMVVCVNPGTDLSAI